MISEKDLSYISTLKTPQGILALIEIPDTNTPQRDDLKNQFSIVLDTIQDPGNLGTIIRTADWFGIKNIICSDETVEAFNPKVVQATMGSLAHVNIVYADLENFLAEIQIPIYAALLHGNSVYETNFGKEGLLLLGNEGNGVSSELLKSETIGVTIPKFGHAESLNVAISTAILCSELKRRDNSV